MSSADKSPQFWLAPDVRQAVNNVRHSFLGQHDAESDRRMTFCRRPGGARLARNLLQWFDRSARDLPWRRTSDLYAIWISEIMLQQTQVATVIAYYERFLARFPDVASLAAADEQEVLRLWEGLGYYRRARQLHAAAKAIVADHDGRFPTTFTAAAADCRASAAIRLARFSRSAWMPACRFWKPTRFASSAG